MASRRRTIITYLRDTVLPKIKTTDGYNFTVGAIKWGMNEVDACPLSQFPVLNIANVTEVRDNITQIHFNAVLEVIILGFVKTSTGTTGTQDEIEKLIEDITKALEQDRLQGGNVTRTTIKKVVTTDGDTDDIGVCAVTVEFQYQREGTTP